MSIDKKTLKIIDGVVKLRIKDYLASTSFKQSIKEIVHKEMIQILLENTMKSNNIVENNTAIRSVRTAQPAKKYPQLPKTAAKPRARTEIRYSKDDTLNRILANTAKDKGGVNSLSYGSPLMDNMDSPGIKQQRGIPAGSVNLNSINDEASLIARSEMSKIGHVGKIIEDNVDYSQFENTSSVPSSPEDSLSDGLQDIETDELMEAMAEDPQYDHVVNALTKDYSSLLNLTEEKVRMRRPSV